ncbi:hypothetical protein F5Y06DRAFT_230385 [Hypoxylon sp. FL0890]|nr:hypothetical protein F5Y06DRAFT_230385 [Hypoxylon sp. FL0890]
MYRHPHHIPAWAMSPGPYDANSRLKTPEVLSEHVSARLSAPQQPSGEGIAPTPSSPLLARAANQEHVHDPMYHRPTYHQQATASPEQPEHGPQHSDTQRRLTREQDALEAERLERRIARLGSRSPARYRRPISPVHSCHGERPSNRQVGSHPDNASVMRTLPTFPHGLPVARHPWIGNTSSFAAAPSPSLRWLTGGPGPNPNPNPNQRSKQPHARQEVQGTDTESAYSPESWDSNPAPPPASALVKPDAQQQRQLPVWSGITQHTGPERNPFVTFWPPSLNQVPPAPNGAASESSAHGSTPSSPSDFILPRAVAVDDVESNLSTRTLAGDEHPEIAQPDMQGTQDRPIVVDDRGAEGRHPRTVRHVHEEPSLTSTHSRREVVGLNAKNLNQQRIREMHKNVCSHLPQQQPPVLLPFLDPAVSGQGERTQQRSDTHDGAVQQTTENVQRSTISVDGDCYINLYSPNELLGADGTAIRMMPFVHVRGDLYIRTTAPRPAKRKPDANSGDEDEVESNTDGGRRAEELNERPTKRR